MRRCRYIALLLVVAFIALASVRSAAQSTDVILGQYYEATPFYNPAASGATDYLRIRGGARLQWIGIDNAPMNFLAVADMPFRINKQRFGTGVVLNSEKIGLFTNMSAKVELSYKIKLFKGVLSIGAEGAYVNQKFRGTDVVLPDEDDYHQSTDEAIPTQDVNGSTFDLGLGIWYTKGEWWAGFSGAHLLQPSIRLKLESTSGESSDMEYYETELARTLYFMGGGNIHIKNTLFELQPSLLAAYDFADFTGEADLRVRYNKMFSFGVGYRWKSALKATLGAEIKNFFLGYTYEYPLSSIAKASSGSHEILAGYRLKIDLGKQNRNKHRSIRLM